MSTHGGGGAGRSRQSAASTGTTGVPGERGAANLDSLRRVTSTREVEVWLAQHAPGPVYDLGNADVGQARAFAEEFAHLAASYPLALRYLDEVTVEGARRAETLVNQAGQRVRLDRADAALTVPQGGGRASWLFSARLFTPEGAAPRPIEAPGPLRRGYSAIQRGTSPNMVAYFARHEFFHVLDHILGDAGPRRDVPLAAQAAARAMHDRLRAAARQGFRVDGGWVSRYAHVSGTEPFVSSGGMREVAAEIFAGAQYGGENARRQFATYLAPVLGSLAATP